MRLPGTMLGCLALAGCSLALDLDSLSEGEGSGGGVEPECESDADCDDGVDCTIDTCEQDGTCLNIPDNDLCDYLEMCDAEEGCVPTGKECKVDSDCNDNVDCTVDRCVLGECENEPDDSVCESDNPCIIEEYCHPQLGCQDGTEKHCEPSEQPCHEALCDPASGDCVEQLVEGADDDGDSYLDADCDTPVPGDDCDDDDPEVHPGADELCNAADDDCDGLTDLAASFGPIEVYSGASALGPALAVGESILAVAWQTGDESDGSAYVRLVDAQGTPITEPTDVGALGGADSVALSPDLTAGDPQLQVDGETHRFALAWVIRQGTVDLGVGLVGLSADGAQVDFSEEALLLETGDATGLRAPRVAWDAAGSGWLAGWIATYPDGAEAVEIQLAEMHLHPQPAVEIDRRQGAVDGFDLAVRAADDYALLYSREDPGSDGDPEVFESRVRLVADVWDQTGFPLLLSEADASAADASTSPALAADGSGGRLAVFVEESSSNYDVLGEAGAGILPLADSASIDELSPAAARGDGLWGVAYLADVGTAVALDLRRFEDDLSQSGAQQAGRLATADATGFISEPRLAGVPGGGIAATWIAGDDTEQRVMLTVFEVCAPTAD
jgi:hypothetical protein